MRVVRLFPLLLALPACVGTPALPVAAIAPAAQPRFDPMTFFAGHTQGNGRLSKLFSGTKPTLVEGQGTMDGGALRLVQQVSGDGSTTRSREWVIREDRPGHYSGTLSDAVGPVTGETHGNRLHLAFTVKGGLRAEQWLTLSPDGQGATNILKVRKFGIAVAILSEDIRRLPE